MRFTVTLKAPDEAARTVEFDCDYDATSVLEQRVYDTIAEDGEWIVGNIARIPERDGTDAAVERGFAREDNDRKLGASET